LKGRKMKNVLAKLSMTMVLSGLIFAGVSALPATVHADDYFYCKVDQVMEYSGRIHAHCSNSITMGDDTIRFVAIANNNDGKSDRFTSQATAAFLAGKRLMAHIKTSSSSNCSGCAVSNCRTPSRFGISN
jgi:hypothetical protein